MKFRSTFNIGMAATMVASLVLSALSQSLASLILRAPESRMLHGLDFGNVMADFEQGPAGGSQVAQSDAGGSQGGIGVGPGGRIGRRGGPGGFGGAGSFGGQGGMMGRFGMEDHDPSRSHETELLQRPEVQNEINLDLKQKNALGGFQQKAQQEMRNQMQQMFQNMRGGRGGAQPGANPQSDPTAMMQQIQQQMTEQRNSFDAKAKAGLAEILRPAQMKRLHDLDLQWRGVLSFGTTDISKEAELTTEKSNGMRNLLNAYQSKIRDEQMQLMQGLRGRQGQGAPTSGGADPNLDSNAKTQAPAQQRPNFQNMMTAMKKAEADARKESEGKALELLGVDGKKTWTAMQGDKFTFRTDQAGRQ